ncbi:MAG: hypothetical protein QNJ54_29760 [Prochloraceae cyanobacterium]|nr:hypothetical protein [Prochloraceae cyanobacterium]
MQEGQKEHCGGIAVNTFDCTPRKGNLAIEEANKRSRQSTSDRDSQQAIETVNKRSRQSTSDRGSQQAIEGETQFSPSSVVREVTGAIPPQFSPPYIMFNYALVAFASHGYANYSSHWSNKREK